MLMLQAVVWVLQSMNQRARPLMKYALYGSGSCVKWRSDHEKTTESC